MNNNDYIDLLNLQDEFIKLKISYLRPITLPLLEFINKKNAKDNAVYKKREIQYTSKWRVLKKLRKSV